MIRKMKELENKKDLHLDLKYNLVEEVIWDSYLNTFISNRKGEKQRYGAREYQVGDGLSFNNNGQEKIHWEDD